MSNIYGGGFGDDDSGLPTTYDLAQDIVIADVVALTDPDLTTVNTRLASLESSDTLQDVAINLKLNTSTYTSNRNADLAAQALVDGAQDTLITGKLDTSTYNTFVNTTYVADQTAQNNSINSKLATSVYNTFVNTTYVADQAAQDSAISAKLDTSVYNTFLTGYNLNNISIDSRLDNLESLPSNSAIQTALDDHINDATDAHNASAIHNTALSGTNPTFSGTNVQTTMQQLGTAIQSLQASGASGQAVNISTIAIPNVSGGVASNVQASLASIQSNVEAISVSGTGFTTLETRVLKTLASGTQFDNMYIKADQNSGFLNNQWAGQVYGASLKPTYIIWDQYLTSQSDVKHSQLWIDGSSAFYTTKDDSKLPFKLIYPNTAGSPVFVSMSSTGKLKLNNDASLNIWQFDTANKTLTFDTGAILKSSTTSINTKQLLDQHITLNSRVNQAVLTTSSPSFAGGTFGTTLNTNNITSSSIGVGDFNLSNTGGFQIYDPTLVSYFNKNELHVHGLLNAVSATHDYFESFSNGDVNIADNAITITAGIVTIPSLVSTTSTVTTTNTTNLNINGNAYVAGDVHAYQSATVTRLGNWAYSNTNQSVLLGYQFGSSFFDNSLVGLTGGGTEGNFITNYNNCIILNSDRSNIRRSEAVINNSISLKTPSTIYADQKNKIVNGTIYIGNTNDFGPESTKANSVIIGINEVQTESFLFDLGISSSYNYNTSGNGKNVLIGNGNRLKQFTQSTVIGCDNYLINNDTGTNVIIGSGNEGFLSQSNVIVGDGNNATTGNEINAAGNQQVIIGSNNSIRGENSIVIGHNNNATGDGPAPTTRIVIGDAWSPTDMSAVGDVVAPNTVCIGSFSESNTTKIVLANGPQGYTGSNSVMRVFWNRDGLHPAFTLGYELSAKKYKTNIQPVTFNIDDIDPVKYNSLHSDETIYGVIADDVKGEWENLVLKKNGEIESFDYEKLSVGLLSVCKQQKNKINQLEEVMKGMHCYIQDLEKRCEVSMQYLHDQMEEIKLAFSKS